MAKLLRGCSPEAAFALAFRVGEKTCRRWETNTPRPDWLSRTPSRINSW